MAIEELNYMTRQTVADVAEMKRRVLGHSVQRGPTWKDAKPIDDMIPTAVRVRVSTNASGGGKYYGYRVLMPTAALSASGNVADADLGASASSQVLIFNAAEVGQSTHDLTILPVRQATFGAWFIGMSDETPPKPTYMINGFDIENC
jgi:hypothetical protein